MSTLTEMMIVYALVTAAFLYVARGWIMKFVFKKEAQSDEGCGSCESGACSSCKAHTFIDQKII
jgi:hypothetical protein